MLTPDSWYYKNGRLTVPFRNRIGNKFRLNRKEVNQKMTQSVALLLKSDAVFIILMHMRTASVQCAGPARAVPLTATKLARTPRQSRFRACAEHSRTACLIHFGNSGLVTSVPPTTELFQIRGAECRLYSAFWRRLCSAYEKPRTASLCTVATRAAGNAN